jgi:hypothetical protein
MNGSTARSSTSSSASITRRALLTGAFGVLLLAGCASTQSGPSTGTGSTAPNPAFESAATTATEPKQRLRIVFDWSLQEREAKFSGSGAIRAEPPYHVRLDLFGPRGEGYLSAALVDWDLRLPPGAPTDVLPPPAMLWSVFGVFRAPQGAQLVSTKGDAANTELVYRAGDQSWTFTLANNRVTKAEWNGPAQGRQTVEIRDYGMRGLPSTVVYRDWRAFRELSVTLTQVSDVADPFPPNTWTPGVR